MLTHSQCYFSSLCFFKLYQLALRQGYSLHLSQFSSVKITDITNVDQFMACFFPEGLDTDQNTFAMKVRYTSLCDCVCPVYLCLKCCVITVSRICFVVLCYKETAVCHPIQALEYLLWASISLELSIPLMTAKYLPVIVTLYCAVCQCYYDNHAEVQAEEFARRALGKINELAKLGEHSEVPATRETQRAYKDASIKARNLSLRYISTLCCCDKMLLFLSVLDTVPWPRTPTERLLTGLFECSAAQFLGILEALWDSNTRPLQMRMPEDPELQEVYLELLSAGISLLSG
uniref:Uncharacterized protein n=1 Tax=Maylandia zebra TaxID=106582 RepID=A0A3P9CSQ4_9CICH